MGEVCGDLRGAADGFESVVAVAVQQGALHIAVAAGLAAGGQAGWCAGRGGLLQPSAVAVGGLQ